MLLFVSTFLLLAASASTQLLAENWPNWIIPISSVHPDKAIGNQKSGHIAVLPRPRAGIDTIGTEIVFDNVPTDTGASYCTISFELASTGPYTLIGDSAPFDIYGVYGGFVSASDTYNSHPPYMEIKMGSVVVENGTVFVTTKPLQCSDAKVQVVLLPTTGAAPFDFTWFELNDPEHDSYNGITFRQWK